MSNTKTILTLFIILAIDLYLAIECAAMIKNDALRQTIMYSAPIIAAFALIALAMRIIRKMPPVTYKSELPPYVQPAVKANKLIHD